MNTCVLIGNLGADPEGFFTDEGTQIVSFSMAFKTIKNKKDLTNWIRVVCFGKQAEAAEKYLHKGAKVAVNGRLEQNKWVDDNNQTKSTYRIVANQVSFLKTDGRGFENGQNNDNIESPTDNDDIPF